MLREVLIYTLIRIRKLLFVIYSKSSTYHRLFLCILVVGSLIHIITKFNRSTSTTEKLLVPDNNISQCSKWKSINHAQLRSHMCPPYNRTITSLWTHDGAGIMKYIQWIATRKLGNVKILRLDDACEIIQENQFLSGTETETWLQIFIVSLAANFGRQSKCSTDLFRMIVLDSRKNNQIYFKRRSVQATLIYQRLDAMRQAHNLTSDWNVSLDANIDQASFTIKRLTGYFNSVSKNNAIIINAEEMIHSKLIDCEKALVNFISLLGFETSSPAFKYIVSHDSYQFTQDATWWDQSETLEHALSMPLQANPEAFNYANDFYHLHANRTFARYVADSRQCFRDGVFFQMPSESVSNRSSTDKPDRCSAKQFDCAFSDLYSFSDREQLYQQCPADQLFNAKPIKCGFAIPSLLDQVRNRYGRNHTCQTIVFTCITNCYDPLPIIQDRVPPNACLVALLDTRTFNTFKRSHSHWDLIDLGESASLFRTPAKITETLKIVGHRMFPLAKWLFWLDGKAFIINMNEVLTLARTPVVGLHHHDFNRTSESEVNLTITRVQVGETPNSARTNTTLQEIELQQAEYRRDGFYSRSAAIGLPMFDIAIFTYRNNHPCVARYLCGWHNEINYFSYRGQLSVYYSAERLNVSDYLGFIPRRFYHTLAHRSMC